MRRALYGESSSAPPEAPVEPRNGYTTDLQHIDILIHFDAPGLLTLQSSLRDCVGAVLSAACRLPAGTSTSVRSHKSRERLLTNKKLS